MDTFHDFTANLGKKGLIITWKLQGDAARYVQVVILQENPLDLRKNLVKQP